MRRTVLALTILGAITPSLAAADPACTAEIRQLMLASVQSGPFEMVSTIAGTNGDEMHNTLRMVPPTALHWLSTVNGTPATEMSFIDGRSFMKMRGAWTELPPGTPSGLLDAYSPAAIEQTVDLLTEAECAIPADWEDNPALRYTFTTRLENTVTNVTMWIAPTSRLPLHSETAYTLDGQAMTATTDYTYDPTITIKAPL